MQELIFPREFDRVARWAADRPALVDLDGGRRTTFAEHHDRVARLSSGLSRGLGVTPSDRFSALMDNRPAYAELWHAGLSGAGIFHSINSRTSADELRHVLRDAGSAVVFAAAPFLPVLDEVRRDLPALRRVVLVGDGEGPHDVAYEELMAAHDPRMPPLPGEDSPCILMYTGGTTGLPRGVLLDQRAAMLNWRKQAEALHPTPEWSFLQVVPMFHVGSMLSILTVHLAGAAINFLPAWDPGRALEVIESERLGALGVVAAMCVQLLHHPAFTPERIASLRYVGYGGGPMPPGLIRRLVDVLPAAAQICQSYGMTEACGMVSILSDADHRGGDPDVLASAGRPMAGCAWSIRDAGGSELPTGEPGEIWIRSGSLMRGYWNQPEASVEALAGDWYHTGDVGCVDDRGYLRIVDRVKDMIITGGENVYSIEVESAISTLPGVARVAVLGVPHEVWGEAVHAVVQTVPGADLTEDAVRAHARATLASYKVPKTVHVQSEEFPLSAAGKVLKRRMRPAPPSAVAGKH